MSQPDAITHRDVLRRLTPEQKRSLTARSDAAGLRQLALHLGLIAGLAVINARHDGLVGIEAIIGHLAMLGQGIAMLFLFTAMHECSHNTAFASRWMNRVTGTAAGFLLVIGPRWFFYFHQDHHRHTQDPERDPELATSKPDSVSAYIVHLSGIPVWWGSLKILVQNAAAGRQDDFVPASQRLAVIREARLMLVGYVGVIFLGVTQGWLVEMVLLPLLLGQPFLRAYLLAEHAGCDEDSDNMLVSTRTLTSAWPVRWLAWNMPYHTEHHSFPAVPFHRLPDLHRLMAGDLVHHETGYATFHRRFANRFGQPN